MDKDIHLAFVTDGRVDHILGIGNVLSQFATFRQNPRSVWIAAPTCVHETVREIVGTATPLTPTYVDAVTQPNDPYGIQMSLGSIFRALPPSETVWAIDHDHLVLGSRRTVPITQGYVWASSERRFPYRRSTGERRRENWSVNVSFLAGRAGDLAAIAALWKSPYTNLSSTVDVRHRTEASFSWSAELSGIQLLQVPPTIQSNFDARVAGPFLFHYGGDTNEALALKAELRRLATRQNPNYQAVHDRLVEELRYWEGTSRLHVFNRNNAAATCRSGPPEGYR